MSFFSLTETPSAVFSEESEQALEPSSDHIDFCSESTSEPQFCSGIQP